MEYSSPSMANSYTHCGLLHRCLGCSVGHSHSLQQDPYVVAPRVCRRSRCAAVVSGVYRIFGYSSPRLLLAIIDVVGYLFPGPLHSVGRQGGPVPRSLFVAVARCSGRHPRCWLGYDLAPDPVASTRLRNLGFRTSHWFSLCHGRSCNCSQ